MAKARFEWDPHKDQENQKKHGVAFAVAQLAFADSRRVIAEDLSHSSAEKRYYCFGEVGSGVLTVRFYVPRRGHPHLRGWILAQRKTDL
jgi:uncharacterized DUF497 family protein